MNKQEQSFLDKANNLFFKFAKDYMPNASASAALAASPFLGTAIVTGALYAAAVVNRVPEAMEAANFMINHPDKSIILEAFKGNLPFEAANVAYTSFVSALGAGLAAAGVSKLIEKFVSLKEEAGHLLKENELLKREFANERATFSGDGRAADTLRGRLGAGLDNMNTRMDQREQATRVKPGPGLR
ncbi:hypothetical protein [Pseudomonas sp. UMAB-40]|uniref:hypothetical protein n=1 Tax=Pseudomonas sp. UMAB-40 TaxID=1365407 RepID=UPI001C564C87|nr:hypothetical protein [Pseudomonas sp. UMAB-40]